VKIIGIDTGKYLEFTEVAFDEKLFGIAIIGTSTFKPKGEWRNKKFSHRKTLPERNCFLAVPLELIRKGLSENDFKTLLESGMIEEEK